MSNVKDAVVKRIRSLCEEQNIKATPHKAHLPALHAICLQIFRHIAQKFLDWRQPAKFLYNLTKNLTAHLAYKLCAVLP